MICLIIDANLSTLTTVPLDIIKMSLIILIAVKAQLIKKWDALLMGITAKYEDTGNKLER